MGVALWTGPLLPLSNNILFLPSPVHGVFKMVKLFKKQKTKLDIVRHQVRDLFTRFPGTIHSDNYLIQKWLGEYHNITYGMSYRFVTAYIMKNKISFESVTRASRYWRAKHPRLYKRDKHKAAIYERAYRSAFTTTRY